MSTVVAATGIGRSAPMLERPASVWRLANDGGCSAGCAVVR
jgi:hypothetical protein